MEKRFILYPSKKAFGDSKIISSRLPSNLITRLEAVADKTNRSRNEVVRSCLEYALSVLVVVGGLVDWMLLFAGSSVGVDLPFQFVVSTLVALWLVCNELLSILENIADIGVELPAFLMPLVRRIKLETQEKVPDKEEESHV